MLHFSGRSLNLNIRNPYIRNKIIFWIFIHYITCKHFSDSDQNLLTADPNLYSDHIYLLNKFLFWKLIFSFLFIFFFSENLKMIVIHRCIQYYSLYLWKVIVVFNTKWAIFSGISWQEQVVFWCNDDGDKVCFVLDQQA